ncbi:hypothetical protein HY212_03345 [Candidatus Pacearchaeota archaeon]|nr:hypothetical protein [Candidatus Pacearchaeota archaeon]
MKESKIYYLNPRHRESKQKSQLCFGGIYKTMLDTRVIEYESDSGLDDLGYELGIHIDKKDIDMFSGKIKERAVEESDPRLGFILENLDIPEIRTMHMANFGLNVEVVRPSDLRDDKTQRYLERHANGKELTSLDVELLKDVCKRDERVVREFLIDNIKKGNDILVNFRYEPFSGRSDGHYVLVEAIEMGDSTDLYVADPSPFAPDYWKESLDKFLYSFMPLWDETEKRERGFAVFSGPNYRPKDDPGKIREFLERVPRYIPSITRLIREAPHPETHLSIKSKEKVA